MSGYSKIHTVNHSIEWFALKGVKSGILTTPSQDRLDNGSGHMTN